VGRARGLGKTLSAYEGEEFHGETDSERFRLRLEKSRLRREGGEPAMCYRFVVLDRSDLPTDDDKHTQSV